MTTSNNIAHLYNTLSKLVKAGDEKAARSFLIEHLTEFPEEAQKKIIFEFFNDALDTSIEEDSRKIQIQLEGMGLIKEIDKAKKTLGDQKKAVDIRLDLMQ